MLMANDVVKIGDLGVAKVGPQYHNAIIQHHAKSHGIAPFFVRTAWQQCL